MERLPDWEAGAENQPQTGGQGRKTRKRSVYLFPAYGFAMALDIARRVEENGGGSLSEETLAVHLGLSVKSSGFRLKILTARQFQLLTKQGDTLSATPTAKAILKPTSNADALNGYRQAFMAIPLFRAVAERYRGQYLPGTQSLRNILEREFQVERGRVQQAEKLLMESARDTQVLTMSGDKTYLTVSGPSPSSPGDELAVQVPYPPTEHEDGASRPDAIAATAPAANTLTFSLDEIGQLDDEEFDTVWAAIGILVKARRDRRCNAGPDTDVEEESLDT